MARKETITIPADFWRNSGMTWDEKILLIEIDAITQNGGVCSYSDAYVSEILGCSVANAKRTMDKLIENGFVKKLDGAKRGVVSCMVFPFKFKGSKKEESVPFSPYSSLSPLSPTTPITTIPPITPIIPTKKKTDARDDVVLPFTSDKFVETWNILIEQPKWKNKSVGALKISLNKLAKYAEPFAVQLMEDSIERGWQGVVFDNTDARYQAWLKNNPQKQEEKRPENYWKQDHHLYGYEDFMDYAPSEFSQLLPKMQEDLLNGQKMLVRNGLWEWPEEYPDYEIYEWLSAK